MRRITRKFFKKRVKCFLPDDRGAALISVVAVVIFLSIIATTVIYISGKNYQIKANDYQNKNTFYQAEMALDEFKGALARDVSEAFQFAYGEIMPDYANEDSGDSRNKSYQEMYFDYLYYKWTGTVKHGTNIPGDVKPYVTPGSGSVYQTVNNFVKKYEEDTGIELKNFKECFLEESDLASEDANLGLGFVNPDDDPDKLGRLIIENIRVSYTENGYSSYICTDIALDPPAYYMGTSTAGGGGAPAKDLSEKLYMGEYILYMNWHKY